MMREKKIVKRLLAVLLVLCMLISVIPMTATRASASPESQEDIASFGGSVQDEEIPSESQEDEMGFDGSVQDEEIPSESQEDVTSIDEPVQDEEIPSESQEDATGFAMAGGSLEYLRPITSLSEPAQKIYAAMRAYQELVQIDGGLTREEMHNAIEEAKAYDPVYMMACQVAIYSGYGTAGVEPDEVLIVYRPGGQEMAKVRYEKFSREVQQAMSLLTPDMTDVEKALVLHDFLCQTTNYAYTGAGHADASGGQTVYGALVHHRGVCGGYANAYRFLLSLAGIENQYIIGTVNGEDHAWNLVKLNGNWYHVDATWDDLVNDGYNDYGYVYFLLTDDAMSRDHSWTASNYPAATDQAYSTFPRGRGECYGREKGITNINGYVYYIDRAPYNSASAGYISCYDLNTRESKTLLTALDGYGSLGNIAVYDGALYVGTYQGGYLCLLKKELDTGTVTDITEDAGLSGIHYGGTDYLWFEESGALHCKYHYWAGEVITEEKIINLFNQEVTAYPVTFDLNGGYGPVNPYAKFEGQPVELPWQVPAKYGYMFRGWATSANAENAEYLPGEEYAVEGSTTLYAVWGETSFSVQYDANGGDGAPETQTKYADAGLGLSRTIPTRTGYTFQGWATSSGATTAQYQPGGSYTQDANVTLYAVWKADQVISTYTVTYNANGGSGAPSSQTKTQSQTLTLSNTRPTRTGYTFQGWATSSGATTAQYQAGGSYTQDANVTLYAVWKANPATYTVTYHANGGSGAPSSQTKTQSQTLTLSSTRPTRTGYTFQGWATSSGATTAQYQPGGSFTQDANVTLYAVWKANTYTVTYHANGGSGAPSSQTKTQSQTLTLSSTRPTRTGYTFQGWATSSGATTAQYQPGGSYTQDANVTLYAVWKAVPSVTTLRLNQGVNGSVSDRSYVWYLFTAPAAGTYVFSTTGSTDTYGELYQSMTGSRTQYNDDSGERFNFMISYPMAANQSIYLKVRGFSPTTSGSYTVSVTKKATTYTVSYNANGGSGVPASQTKTQSQTLTLSNTRPTRTGYTFQGWATSSGATTAQYQPGGSFTQDANVTLYAVWKAVPSVTTLQLNQDENGHISSGSCTWYQFTAPATGMYIFSTTGSTDTYGELYQSMTGSCTKYNDDGGDGHNFLMSYSMSAGQTIYLKVRGWSSGTFGSYRVCARNETYTVRYDANGGSGAPLSETKIDGEPLTLNTRKPDRTGYSFQGWATSSSATTAQYQPGGSYTQNANVTLYAVWKYNVTTLQLNQGVKGSVSDGIHRTWYQFTAPATGTYIFSTTGSTDTYADMYRSLTDPRENRIKYDDNSFGDGKNFLISYSMTANETIYLNVYSFIDRTGSYTISVMPETTTLQLNQGVNGSVSDGSYIWYQFTAPSAGTYMFSTTGSTDTYGELYQSMTGSCTKYNDDGGDDRNFLISYPMTANQTIYLKVRGFWSGTSGSYTVSVKR